MRALAGTAVGTAFVIVRLFTGNAPLQSAGSNEVSFLDNGRYAVALEQTMAGAVIGHPQMPTRVPSGTTAIVTAATCEGWARRGTVSSGAATDPRVSSFGAGRPGRPSRSICPDRYAGRRRLGRPHRSDFAGEPRPTAQGILPPGRHIETDDPAAWVARPGRRPGPIIRIYPGALRTGWWPACVSGLTSPFKVSGDGKADDSGDGDGRAGGNCPRNKSAEQQTIPRR